MTTQFTGNNSTGPEGHKVREDRTLSHGKLSRPLLGRLPAARWVPMDVHSMMDYGTVVAAGVGALKTHNAKAKIASIALASAKLITSSLADNRLSVAKKIPIEAHETLDYAWGVAAIAAPFVFGYWKKAPRVALSHVIAGASNILASLVTDYRAYRGSAHQLRARAARAR